MAYANPDNDNHASIGLRFRRMVVRSTSFVVAIGVCLVLYALVAGQGSLTGLFIAVGIAHGPHPRIGYFLIVALIVFTLIVRMSCNSLDVWSTESEMDSFHRRRNSTILLSLMFIGCYLVYLANSGNVPPLHSPIYAVGTLLYLAGEIIYGPILFSAKAYAAVAREVSEDEFYRAMRAKASKVGYAVVMLAGSVALLLLHHHLAQEPAILFAVLYAGVAGSLLYYDYLLWRADRVH